MKEAKRTPFRKVKAVTVWLECGHNLIIGSSANSGHFGTHLQCVFCDPKAMSQIQKHGRALEKLANKRKGSK